MTDSMQIRLSRLNLSSRNSILLSAVFSAACLCLLDPYGLRAQSAPSGSQASPPLRVATHLVEVHVIVRDKKGVPVTGLAKEDFTLLDQGQPQQIAFFSEESGNLTQASAPGQPLPPGTFSNRYEQTGQLPGRVTVILLDALNTPFVVQSYMRYSAHKALHQVNPQDRVAIYVLGHTRLRIIQDFTQDSSALLRAINAEKGEYDPSVDASAGDNALTGGDPFSDEWDAKAGATGWNAMWAQSFAPGRAQFASQAIAAIANHLASVPGRKSLVWISSRFPVSMGLTRVLNQYDIAVYPMDPGGLRNAPAFAVTTGQVSLMNDRPAEGSPVIKSNPSVDSATMNELAERTGGRATYNYNDIAGSVRTAIDDGRSSYILGYYPAHGKWDGQFREISVKVDRPDVQVRSRKGYFAFSEAPSDQKEMHAAIEDALRSPLEATSVGITVSVQAVPQKSQAIFNLNIDAHGVRLDQDSGFHKGVLEIVFRQLGAGGSPINTVAGHLALDLSQQTYDRAMQEGIKMARPMEILPGAETLRVLVFDTASGAMGTVTVPVSNYAPPVPEGTAAPPSAPAATKGP